jgi:transcription elongation factor SPT5
VIVKFKCKNPNFNCISRRYRDFIIEEAEVDSDVDEDDEEYDNVGEIGIVGNEVEESGQTAREIENRRRIHTLWE